MIEFGTFSLVAIILASMSAGVSLVTILIARLVSHRVKISEFRRAWIDDQRKDVAEYLGLSREWVELYDQLKFLNEKTKAQNELFFSTANKARVIYWRIEMRLNPLPNDFEREDKLFLSSLYKLLEPPPPDQAGANSAEMRWRSLADEAVRHSQMLFKREWQLTK